jgi:L-ribulose-5-phosphate 3-epimerase
MEIMNYSKVSNNLNMNDIGFIQGRLSPMVGNRIQTFPWSTWKDEFKISGENNFKLIEWTLDQEDLYRNPLLTNKGQSEINSLCELHGISIPSLTGDCFMQAPFWKTTAAKQKDLKNDFIKVLEACVSVGISMIVVPLVDNGRIDNAKEEDILVKFLEDKEVFLYKNRLTILFESDFDAKGLSKFISRLNPDLFGINYDIGNSAALGFDATEEIDCYGYRIKNVHVKDRLLGGTTVPLGMGNADFIKVFSNLNRVGYKGNFILQTARSTDGDHLGVLRKFREMTANWISHSGT